MSNEPRRMPRFIPTLTEVVDPATLNYGPDRPTPDVQALVDEVQRRVRPAFERRLQQEYERLVRILVTEPWDEISHRLQSEMDGFVQRTVTDYLEQQNARPKEEIDT